MLATLADAPLVQPGLIYEPKYDGIRALVHVAPGNDVRVWSRLGNDKTRQFPSLVSALAITPGSLQRRSRTPPMTAWSTPYSLRSACTRSSGDSCGSDMRSR